MAAKMGRLYRRVNSKKHHRANADYLFVRVESEDGGHERMLALTDFEVKRAEARAKKNPEDAPKAGLIQDLLD
jgi:hypothetical protein